MIQTVRFSIVLTALALAMTSLTAAQKTVGDAVASIQRERIQASYLLAFGRLATDDEVKYWSSQNPKSVSELVTKHRDYLSRDVSTHQETIRRSYVAALGTSPKAAETKHWMSGNDTFTMLVTNHVNWLRSNPNEYSEVIKRSYQNVLRRPATDAEIKYWKGQGVFGYSVLAACHEDFKRRGGERTGNAVVPTSSSYLSSYPVSAAVLAETRNAVGVLSHNGAAIVGNAAGNLVAAGAGNMVAAGGGNMVAAGGGNMVAAGGGN
jgi:hypothetical protein